MLSKIAKHISVRQMKNNLRINLVSLMSIEGMNQKSLSEKTGISRQNIAKYMSGKAIPNSYTLYQLADALYTTCDYLIGKEEGTDHELNYIIERIGLSEKAVNTLVEYTNSEKNDKYELLFAISKIIESEFSADFFLSFCKYTAIPDIDKDDFSRPCYSRLYGAYNYFLTAGKAYDNEYLDTIKIDEIIYHQLMKNFQELLYKIKNNPNTKEEYIRMFEQRIQTEHDIEQQEEIDNLINLMETKQ